MRIKIEPRSSLFLAYFLANAYSIGYVLFTGKLLSFDAASDINTNFQFIAFSILFLASYYWILFPIFNWLSKINFSTPYLYEGESESHESSVLGLLILTLQLVYFSFVLVFDAGKVGAEIASVPFSKFWAAVQIDFLTAYYLAASPKNKCWKLNFALFAISNLVRGWTGFIIILAFIHLCRRDSPLTIKTRGMIIGIAALLLFTPFLLYVKFYIRTRSPGIDFESLLSVVFGYDNYWEFIRYSFEYTINRVQQFSLTWFVWLAGADLSQAYAQGQISPYWSENLYGNLVLKAFGHNIPPNLGVFATQFIPYDFEVSLGEFNISPGIIGWIGATGDSALGLIIYLFLMLVIGLFVIQLIYKRGSPKWFQLSNILWLMWLTLFLPGWMNQFFAFLHAGLVFFVVTLLCKGFKGKVTRSIIPPSVQAPHVSRTYLTNK